MKSITPVITRISKSGINSDNNNLSKSVITNTGIITRIGLKNLLLNPGEYFTFFLTNNIERPM